MGLSDKNLTEMSLGIFSGLPSLDTLINSGNPLSFLPFSFASDISVDDGIPACEEGFTSGASFGPDASVGGLMVVGTAVAVGFCF